MTIRLPRGSVTLRKWGSKVAMRSVLSLPASATSDASASPRTGWRRAMRSVSSIASAHQRTVIAPLSRSFQSAVAALRAGERAVHLRGDQRRRDELVVERAQQLGDRLVAGVGAVVGGDDGRGVEHDAHRRELNTPIDSFARASAVSQRPRACGG